MGLLSGTVLKSAAREATSYGGSKESVSPKALRLVEDYVADPEFAVAEGGGLNSASEKAIERCAGPC